MAYDRADNDPARDEVRIAFFIAWAMLSGLAGQVHLEDTQALLRHLHEHEIAPRKFLKIACDDKFWEEDLSAEGNLFARAYYLQRRGLLNYFDDYKRIFLADYANLTLVADTWGNYDKIAPMISGRYEEWRRSRTLS